MTPALLFHQTQELLLHSEQKRLLASLNAQRIAFYPVYPLWCFFTSHEVRTLSAAELKRRIARLKIKSPVRAGKHIVFPVNIGLNDGIYIEEKIICAVHAQNDTDDQQNEDENLASIASNDLFPIPCRIFRIAETETDGTQYDAFNTVWVKRTD